MTAMTEQGPAIVSLLVALPLIGASLAFGFGRRVAGPIAGLTAALLLGASATLLWLVFTTGELRVEIGGWAPPLGVALGADGLTALLIATSTTVYAAIAVHVGAVLRRRELAQPERWLVWPLSLICLAGIHGALLSRDLFNLYVALEILGLSSVSLIAWVGGAAVTAALRYLLVTLTGSLLYLLGVALIYADYGVVDIATLAPSIAAQPATRAALVAMTVGLLFKAGVAPLHAWLAPAHALAFPPIAALLSGLVDEVIVLVLIRIWIELFAGVLAGGVAEALGLLGAVAIVWGSAQAIAQDRLAWLVAYSTVAQLGYLLLGFALGDAAWAGVAVFVAAHACAKAAMFLAAGELARAGDGGELSALRGLARRTPASSFAFALAGVALIGLPPSGVFVGKWLLLDAAIAGGRWGYVIVIVGGSLLAAAYVFRVVALLLRDAPEPIAEEPRVPTLRAAPLALALLAVGLGFAAAPMLALLEVR